MKSTQLNLLDSSMFGQEYFFDRNMCVFCWSKCFVQNLCTTKGESNTDYGNQLIYKVQYCLGMELSSEDYENFFIKICKICCTRMEEFYAFKRSCLQNHRQLKQIFKNCDNNSSPHLDFTETVSEKVETFSDIETESLDSITDNYQSLSPLVPIPSSPVPLEDTESTKTKQNSDNYQSLSLLVPIPSSPVPLEDTESTKTKPNPAKPKPSRYKLKRSVTYCNICSSDFVDKETFAIHNSEAHGVEINGEFKCFGCDRRFKTRKARLAHEKNFCKALKDGYKCSICSCFLPKRRMYETHMKNHRNNVVAELPEDIFKCSRCDKHFKTKEDLRNHYKDCGKKIYVCETCGRVFARQDYLQKHVLTHTGVKRHTCPHCSFSAAQRSSLTVHMRKHTGERPYECDLCLQRCVSSSNLRSHRNRHLGIAAFQCRLCPKKFGYKKSLEEHVASVHERSESYLCTQCSATYTRLRGLRRHMLAKHGIQLKKTDQGVLYHEDKETNDDTYPNLNSAKEQGDLFNEKSKTVESDLFLTFNEKSVYSEHIQDN